jgi:hypothetical protein
MKKTLVSIILLITLSSCYNDNVDINSKPKNIKSAKNIALTIAKIADCKSSFEDYDFQKNYNTFTCQKNINNIDHMFFISVFYDENIDQNTLYKSDEIRKKGKYFIITDSLSDDLRKNGIKSTKEDFNNFPGEIVLPKK